MGSYSKKNKTTNKAKAKAPKYNKFGKPHPTWTCYGSPLFQDHKYKFWYCFHCHWPGRLL
jgi:hypothetical protein